MIGQCFLCPQRAPWHREFCNTCWAGLCRHFHTRHRPARTVGDLAVVSAGAYQNELRDYLLRLKALAVPSLENVEFLREIVEYWAPELLPFGATAIVAVPRSPWRWFRHFDVPGFLALTLARALKIPLLTPAPAKEILHELIHGPQKNKSRADRYRYPPRFRVPRRTRPAAARVLLVDDLCSSGASLLALRRELTAAGHLGVGAFCFLDNHGESSAHANTRRRKYSADD